MSKDSQKFQGWTEATIKDLKEYHSARFDILEKKLDDLAREMMKQKDFCNATRESFSDRLVKIETSARIAGGLFGSIVAILVTIVSKIFFR